LAPAVILGYAVSRDPFTLPFPATSRETIPFILAIVQDIGRLLFWFSADDAIHRYALNQVVWKGFPCLRTRMAKNKQVLL
ncbi:MAG TPA: hypothetical protein VJ488_00925, partial [Dehalococcoidia bacterium]|nr:hypothetical protein [Dehalococcoidia bacterium]